MIAQRLASEIAVAAGIRGLYPANHPRVIECTTRIMATLQESFEESGEQQITWLIVGSDLVIGEEVIRNATLSVEEFLTLMRQRGIERLTLESGITAGEIRQFVDALANGAPLPALPHVTTGNVRIVLEEQAQAEQGKRKPLTVEQLEIVRAAWARFRVEQKLPVDQLEELVWSLIDSISSTTRAMLPLAALKEHDEYTYVHSVNVSLLVLAQARSYGIWGPMLHAFGMAALLHDVGKLMVPITVLNKPGKLDPDEWEVMKTHCREGAWHLGQIANVTPLSAVVAYEHHFRVDGRPNYPAVKTSRLPNLAARMTAIADTYDAIMTMRPYQQPLGRASAFEVLRSRSGSFYDGALVGNFVRLMETEG